MPLIILNPSKAVAAVAKPIISMMSHFEGTNGSKVIVDDSGNYQNVTMSGSATISNLQKKFGSTSIRLFATDNILLPTNSNLLLNGDYTIEFWMYPTAAPTSTAGTRLMSKGADGSYPAYGIEFRTDRTIAAYFGNGTNASISNGAVVAVSTPLALNTWSLITLQRSGAVCQVFVNGVLGASNTPPTPQYDKNNTDPIQLAYHFTGFIDEVRITKNLARYSGNFTPPAAPFTKDF